MGGGRAGEGAEAVEAGFALWDSDVGAVSVGGALGVIGRGPVSLIAIAMSPHAIQILWVLGLGPQGGGCRCTMVRFFEGRLPERWVLGRGVVTASSLHATTVSRLGGLS